MRYSASEKYEIIQLVERSDLSVRKTLAHLDIHRSTFYNWLQRYRDGGVDGLNDMKPVTDSAWNIIPALHRTAIIGMALAEPQLSEKGDRFIITGNDRFWPEVRVSNSVKLCLYSCRERQVAGQTRNYMKSLYKSPLYLRKRP